MSIHVLHPGAFSLVVDGGRPHLRHRGVALGGAADRAAWMIGNALIGNASDAPALEIALAGPTLRAKVDLGLCLFGAPFRIECDQKIIPSGSTFTLRAGQTLSIGGTPTGVRAYLCVAGGGFSGPDVLGSRSDLTPLQGGESLSCRGSRVALRCLAATDARQVMGITDPPAVIRVMPVAQADWLDMRAFSEAEYRVTPASNRMGLRLEGPPVQRRSGEMVSEAVAPGAVQVTNEGQCIVLGVDGQTIGGYPKGAHVIRADLDRLAQLRPGDSIRFLPVTLEMSESLGHLVAERLDQTLQRIGLAEWLPSVETG